MLREMKGALRALQVAVVVVAAASSARAARPAQPPPAPLPVKAEGVVVTGVVRGTDRVRYRVTLPTKGTLIISAQQIHGPAPRMVLRQADGKILRRDRNGQLWTRATPGEELTLEVFARPGGAPHAETPSTYALRAVFDVDRPRAEREQQRPARPGDVVAVPSHGRSVERVLVDGIHAEHVEGKGGFLVTIPAFARSGVIELEHESGARDTVTLALIGAEAVRPDRIAEACTAADEAASGCIHVALSPAVGSAWLSEIARVVDADVVSHEQKTGALMLKLRIASSEGFALSTLRAMPGIRDARR